MDGRPGTAASPFAAGRDRRAQAGRSGRSYAGAYVGASGQLAPVTALGTWRQVGRLVKVDPTATGAELDLIVGDDDVWHRLAGGSAQVGVLVAFTGSSGGDPVDGRPLRVEIG